MGKTSIYSAVKRLQSSIIKHSPEILTGVGILGMLTTTAAAVRATPKALRLMEEKKEQDEKETLSPLETVKIVWTCYIPAAVIGAASVACLIGANSVNARRRAVLAAAYSISESAMREYQEKVVETIGEKKEQSVRDAVAKSKVERYPVRSQEIVITETGDTLCYDVISGRYFKSDIEKLKRAENKLNRDMLGEMYISLNDFYYEIGLDGIRLGDQLGWHIDRGYIDLAFSSQLTKDGTPCLVLDYRVAPRYDYQDG